MAYSGWKLNDADRERLLEEFPPRFPDVVAHHVTKNLKPFVPAEAEVVVVGYACDDGGVEVLVVEVNGTSARPDGSTYHITWSLDRAAGRKPVHSNEVLQQLGWGGLDTPIPVSTRAFCVDNKGEENFR